MSLGSVTSIAVQGMQAQSTRLSSAANNIANIASTGYAPQTAKLASQMPGGVSAEIVQGAPGTRDPQADMLDSLESAQSFALNAAVFETGADLWDVVANIKR